MNRLEIKSHIARILEKHYPAAHEPEHLKFKRQRRELALDAFDIVKSYGFKVKMIKEQI